MLEQASWSLEKFSEEESPLNVPIKCRNLNPNFNSKPFGNIVT